MPCRLAIVMTLACGALAPGQESPPVEVRALERALGLPVALVDGVFRAT